MRLGIRSIACASLVTPLICAACSGEPGDHREEGKGAGASRPAAAAGGGGAAPESNAGGGGGGDTPWSAGPFIVDGPCPRDMALVAGFCMDRYEAPNQPGARPMVMQSAVTAAAWCKARGKRLCTEDEWDTACEGPEGLTYPYGDTHEAEGCNDNKTWIQPDEATIDTWPSAAAQAEVDRLYQAAPSGSFPKCVSGYGVYDLTGNVEEWVVRTRYHVNEYPHVLKGCYWSGCFGGSKPTCLSTNPAHADGFMFYETSFRCCRDAE